MFSDKATKAKNSKSKMNMAVQSRGKERPLKKSENKKARRAAEL